MPVFPACVYDLFQTAASNLDFGAAAVNDTTSSSAFAGNWTALVDAVIPDTNTINQLAGGYDASGSATGSDDGNNLSDDPDFYDPLNSGRQSRIIRTSIGIFIPVIALALAGMGYWWWRRRRSQAHN